MIITIDENDKRPLYQQVIDEIKRLIARGELREGATLPPVRQVAADLGVNFNTIAVAYRELQREGLINVRHGAGAIVTSSTANEKHDEELLAPLRASLTQLVLAGHARGQIMSIVGDELRKLLKGAN
ncbi:MAG: GntR family transcriptional regulator [Pyrinomonadaceae bacterium]